MVTNLHRTFRPARIALAAGLALGGPADRLRRHGRPRPRCRPPARRRRAGAAAGLGPGVQEGRGRRVNPYAAEAGAQILERGGNAVDAAVAIAYALNVVEPQSAGIGGGGFMLIHLAQHRRTFVIDTREKAPAGATPDMFVNVPNASLQGVAVGVPGMVRGTALAVRKYGKLELDDVLAPATQLADQGFAATARYAAVSCNSRSQNSPESAAFFCPGGAAPVQARWCRTSRWRRPSGLIARHGPDCFYKYMPQKGCDIAKGIVEGQKFNRRRRPTAQGGSMTYADLENYQAVERAGRRQLPRLPHQGGDAAVVGRADDPADAQDAGALSSATPARATASAASRRST